MQLVIEIDKKVFDYMKECSFVENTEVMLKQSVEDRVKTLMLFDMINALKNGTPLPEGHGRIGDLDELEQRISNFVERDAEITDEYTVIRQRFIVEGIRETPTIIEADKEG